MPFSRKVVSTAILLFQAVQAHLNCSSLLHTKINNSTQITSTQLLPQGSNFTGSTLESSYNTLQTNLPQLCRVIFNVTTSPISSASAELWLPVDWNGRFLAVGNSGFAGGINYPDIVWGVRKGFATVSTNTGHESSSGDGTWMLDNSEAMIDFGHRGLHLTTGAAKRIVEVFYGKGDYFSYYAGCSTGGRQGLNAAQRYSGDYDGVLAGSAIAYQTHTSAWQTYVALHQYQSCREFFSSLK